MWWANAPAVTERRPGAMPPSAKLPSAPVIAVVNSGTRSSPRRRASTGPCRLARRLAVAVDQGADQGGAAADGDHQQGARLGDAVAATSPPARSRRLRGHQVVVGQAVDGEATLGVEHRRDRDHPHHQARPLHAPRRSRPAPARRSDRRPGRRSAPPGERKLDVPADRGARHHALREWRSRSPRRCRRRRSSRSARSGPDRRDRGAVAKHRRAAPAAEARPRSARRRTAAPASSTTRPVIVRSGGRRHRRRERDRQLVVTGRRRRAGPGRARSRRARLEQGLVGRVEAKRPRVRR